MAPTRPRLALVALAALLVLAPGCTLGSSAEEELMEEIEVNRAVWEARRPAAYRMVLARSCFCGVEGRGPVELEVDGDSVTGRRYVAELDAPVAGEPVSGELAPFFPDVDGLFELLLEAAVTGADDVTVTWDPALGFPRSFFIDYRENVADEEQGYEIVEGPEELPAAATAP